MADPLAQLPYEQVWIADFEFLGGVGQRAEPVCMVARETRSGTLLRLWRDELLELRRPPFPIDAGALFVAYYASAELGCFLTLGWPMPERVLDLYAEFRALTNGRDLPCGRGLLGALAWFGVPGLTALEKDAMRDLVMRGGPWTACEQQAVLDYCQSDVDALAALLPRMLPSVLGRGSKPNVSWGRALQRGRYMAAAARMERAGVPIDAPVLERLRRHWDALKHSLIVAVDASYGVFEGTAFKEERFERYLLQRRMPWPRHPSGRLTLNREVFRDQAKAHPELHPLRELLATLGELRLSKLAVGPDARNRCLLSAYSSKTGRNQPSTTRFIFGPATWLRGLIRPEADMAVAYVDFSSQEIGIAAALSGDEAMLEAYRSGDPYLGFAIQAGLAPGGATKATHKAERDRCKAVLLGTLYGMGAETLAARLGCLPIEARGLLRLLERTYQRFWDWRQRVVDTAVLTRSIETVAGWPLHVGSDVNPRTLMNFPMQANGAEMLRLGCCLATERAIRVCAPVHDALLIEAPLSEIDARVVQLQAIMREASRIVLGGVLELGSDAKIVRWPDRYMDERGAAMWTTVMGLLDELEPP